MNKASIIFTDKSQNLATNMEICNVSVENVIIECKHSLEFSFLITFCIRKYPPYALFFPLMKKICLNLGQVIEQLQFGSKPKDLICFSLCLLGSDPAVTPLCGIPVYDLWPVGCCSWRDCWEKSCDGSWCLHLLWLWSRHPTDWDLWISVYMVTTPPQNHFVWRGWRAAHASVYHSLKFVHRCEPEQNVSPKWQRISIKG